MTGVVCEDEPRDPWWGSLDYAEIMRRTVTPVKNFSRTKVISYVPSTDAMNALELLLAAILREDRGRRASLNVAAAVEHAAKLLDREIIWRHDLERERRQ